MLNIDIALDLYGDEVEQLIQVIRPFNDEWFLQPTDGWSPRDVVAHLIGWNRHVIDVANAAVLNEIPQVFVDPGLDFCNVNAASVARYCSKDRDELVEQLSTSFDDMSVRVRKLSPETWSREIDVPGLSYRPSVAKNVNALIEDYAQHRETLQMLSG